MNISALIKGLPQLPAGAANHFMYGTFGYVFMAALGRLTGMPWWSAIAATIIVAAAKKTADSVMIHQWTLKDFTTDVFAQVGGGVVCLLVQAVGF